MFARLPSLFILLAAIVVVASSPEAALNAGNSTTPAFQLDLSRRFSSTVELLKHRRRDAPTKTSRAGMTRKRTMSEELLAMLKAATHLLAAPSASSSASARPRPSASAAASAWASHAAGAAAASKPSSSLSPSSAKAAQKNVEYVKRMIQQEPWETLDSRLLCPVGETACPIFPRMGTYECLDTTSELESCGGCISKGAGEDCTSIKGAQGVTCESGDCIVFTCQAGYKFDGDFKRSNGGKGRCRKMLTPKERRSPVLAAREKAEKEKEAMVAKRAGEEEKVVVA
ncbi:hypothetical protein JCM11641_003476 [Rhodosporidiobolus odoratus]